MVRQIRIYVEGGGDSRNQKAQLRQGFSQFLRPPPLSPPNIGGGKRGGRKNVKVIVCGSREHTFRDFKNALKRHPNAFNVLLVDSEGPVRKIPWLHLRERDGWQKPPHVTNEQCHLMVQMMEAWLIADLDTLQKFYKQGFNAKAIPKNPNIEKISKKQLERALKSATKNTKKGTYHKMKHGPAILARINVDKVRAASAHCDRLLTILTQKLAS